LETNMTGRYFIVPDGRCVKPGTKCYHPLIILEM
jgi:hypothetical protein